MNNQCFRSNSVKITNSSTVADENIYKEDCFNLLEVMYMLGLVAGMATGIALLLALVFAEYSDIREKSEKAFTWIGAGAVSFILGGVIFTLNNGLWAKLDATAIGENGLLLFQAIGVILVIIGSVWALFDLITQNM